MFSFKKAWQTLDIKQKRNLVFIFSLMIFSMLLEALSIGIILPLLSIFLKGSYMKN